MNRHAVMLLASAGINAQHALAQNHPARAIRLAIPSSPGGGGNILGRILGQK